MYQSINHIKHLDFSHFFNTNGFYPHPYTLLYSDILLPQAVIALPFSYLSTNPILVFNITFVITFILNYFSAFLFWKVIFKKDHIAFLGSLFTVFSPAFQLQMSHFQMLSIWPFFLTLYFIFKDSDRQNIKYLIYSGIFLSLQFLASVYLALFLLFSLILYYTIHLFYQRKVVDVIKRISIVIGLFIFVDGIFIKAYIDMKHYYNISRSIGEYINYSAHLSDYIFTTFRDSLLYNFSIFGKWNAFDKHFSGGLFPGFLFVVLSVFGVFVFQKIKGKTYLSIELTEQKVYFILITLCGMLFSLGPRLSFNGQYAHIPTPYWILLKFVPFFEAVRASARWYFLFYVGIVYFALSSFNSKKLKISIVLSFVSLLFIFEYIPLNVQAEKVNYFDKSYQILQEQCKYERKVLLELPLMHFDYAKGIVYGLSYISQVELASVYHKCSIVNGYSGYDPQYLFEMKDKVYAYIHKHDVDGLISYLRSHKVSFIKIDESGLLSEVKPDFISIKKEFESKVHRKLAKDLYEL